MLYKFNVFFIYIIVLFFVLNILYLNLCNRNIAEDVFGRVEGEFFFTVVNTFKLDYWYILLFIKKYYFFNWINI